MSWTQARMSLDRKLQGFSLNHWTMKSDHSDFEPDLWTDLGSRIEHLGKYSFHRNQRASKGLHTSPRTHRNTFFFVILSSEQKSHRLKRISARRACSVEGLVEWPPEVGRIVASTSFGHSEKSRRVHAKPVWELLLYM